MQRFQVLPSEADKESAYIGKNIQATRTAFGLDDTTVSEYNAQTKLSPTQLNTDAASLPGIRLVDPKVVSETFEQLQQVRGYYRVPGVLDVDRYKIDGRERDMVVAAREVNIDGLPDAQKKWANEKTVYTHGYGLIAAYGNQRDAQTSRSPTTAARRSSPRSSCRPPRARSATSSPTRPTAARSTSASTARRTPSSARPPTARTSSSTSRRAPTRGSRRRPPTRARTASASATSSTSCCTP